MAKELAAEARAAWKKAAAAPSPSSADQAPTEAGVVAALERAMEAADLAGIKAAIAGIWRGGGGDGRAGPRAADGEAAGGGAQGREEEAARGRRRRRREASRRPGALPLGPSRRRVAAGVATAVARDDGGHGRLFLWPREATRRRRRLSLGSDSLLSAATASRAPTAFKLYRLAPLAQATAVPRNFSSAHRSQPPAAARPAPRGPAYGLLGVAPRARHLGQHAHPRRLRHRHAAAARAPTPLVHAVAQPPQATGPRRRRAEARRRHDARSSRRSATCSAGRQRPAPETTGALELAA